MCAASTAYPPNAPARSDPATGSEPSPNATWTSSAATSPSTPVRVANEPETSRPVTASRSGAAERVSSSAPDSFGSARSSTSASDSAPEPDVDVTVTRYRANAVGSATVKGRVCRAQRNCSPDRSSSVVHVSPSSEPSRVHADGDAVPLAPEVSVYDPTVGRMPLPAHVIDGVEVANVVRVPDVLSVSAAALVVASPSATVVVPRPAVVASCTGVGARRPR